MSIEALEAELQFPAQLTMPQAELTMWIAENGDKGFTAVNGETADTSSALLSPGQQRQKMVTDIGRQVRAEFGEAHHGKNNMTDALRAEKAAR